MASFLRGFARVMTPGQMIGGVAIVGATYGAYRVGAYQLEIRQVCKGKDWEHMQSVPHGYATFVAHVSALPLVPLATVTRAAYQHPDRDPGAKTVVGHTPTTAASRPSAGRTRTQPTAASRPLIAPLRAEP